MIKGVTKNTPLNLLHSLIEYFNYPVILKKFKIAYWPVPKNASSTLLATIYKINYGIEFNDVLIGSKVYLHPHRVYRSRPFKKRPNLENYFKFAVVRNPIKRFISFYKEKIIHARFFLKELPFKERRNFDNPTITHVINNLDKLRSLSETVRIHTNPQTLYLGDDPNFYSKIYDSSQIDKLFIDLENYTGAKLQIVERNEGKIKTDVHLSNDDIMILKEFYKKDFKFIENSNYDHK